jgi:benzylsuccinate CoA-transferase BbsF subunit
MSSKLPLNGIRVIDFTWVGAGPFTTKILADFGAEVIKIESRTRPDQLRRAEPLVGSRGLEESGYFVVRNTNKKSVSIDMKAQGARDLVLDMARNAEVMANSFSPKAMKKFGLEYTDVAAANPRIVFLSMPMAGATGPYRDYIGYGMSIAAITGMFGLGGAPDRPPVGTGTNFPDHLPNPLHAAFAVLAALAWCKKSGKGQEIAISQIESTMAAFPDAVLDYAANSRVGAPGESKDGYAFRGVMRCAGDERWCAIALKTPQLTALGDIFGDKTVASRSPANVEQALRTWAQGRTAEEVERKLQGAGIAASVVARPSDLIAKDGQLNARGFWQHLDHPVMGKTLYHGIAAKFSRTPTDYRNCAPLLGQHNDELSALAGLSAGQCAALAAQGVIK